ncbi:siderophore-interacting protein [Aurantiacibacter rhizosphaerae]|uniref:siderophore-interacting protein n=1 Tax=Aurantiacibacter rhizosphaerae TaxID=2691582 RepID=UPI00301B961E
MAPPNRPPPREFEVLSRHNVSPNLLRITLGGPAMAHFPDGQEGGYLKLHLPLADGKVAVRTYTIRAQRRDGLDIDFALHAETATGHAGPATDWAMTVAPGARVKVSGPGPAKPLVEGHDFYMVAGDMTALPAISVNLAALPADARGLAVIEVMDDADAQDLVKPDGVEIQWLVVPQPGSQPEALAQRLQAREWPQGSVYAWSASEFTAMKALRKYLREDRELGPDRLYISSYWKCGLTEEDHKRIKREDADAQ